MPRPLSHLDLGKNGSTQFQLSPHQATAGGNLLLTITPVIGDAAKAKLAVAVTPPP